MLTEVRVTTPQDALAPELVLPIGGPSNFPIQYIDGLSPADAEIATSKYAIVCGEHFDGSRANMRNIVLTLELVPDYSEYQTVEQLRAELYRYFKPKEETIMTFVSSEFGERWISGYVETLEAPLFVDKPAAQISILCPNPYFRSTVVTQTGSASANSPITIDNVGELSSGALITIEQAPSTNSVTITNTAINASTEYTMQINRSLPTNFTMSVNTNTGRKDAFLVGDQNPSLLKDLSFDSEWIKIHPGVNQLVVGIKGGGTDPQVTVEYEERYIGL